MSKKKLVIALGGNALGNTPEEQLELVKETASTIVDLVEEGYDVVVGHGNGPQVGMINLAMEFSANNGGKTPAMPFPECGAMSQGYIGYHLQQAIQRELARRGARLAQYDRGALVHGCDGQCLGMIRVQSGRLRACMLSDDGREITLYRLTDGDACVLAAACVIRQITFEVQLVADAPTELLILGAHVFQQLAAENIHVECCMYRLATERFSDVMWAMQQLLFTSFDKRLAQYLWDESDHARAPVRATHEQIARDTGAVRETVTRMLRHFADDGIVSLGRGTVTVADAEKLRRLAGM